MTIEPFCLEELAIQKCETTEGTLRLTTYAISFMFDDLRNHRKPRAYRSVVIAMIGCCRQILKDHPELDVDPVSKESGGILRHLAWIEGMVQKAANAPSTPDLDSAEEVIPP